MALPAHAERLDSLHDLEREQALADDLQADQDHGLTDPPVGRAQAGVCEIPADGPESPPPGGQIVREPDMRTLIVKVAERFTDHKLGTAPPGDLFRYVDARAIEAIEEALAGVEVPSESEWLA